MKYDVNFGQRFGKLTAHKLIYTGALASPLPKGVYAWGCECDCGEELIARSDDLVAGRVKACNKCSEEQYRELKLDDLTGAPFGHLQVVRPVQARFADAPRRFWDPVYLVQCSCGRLFRARHQSLLEGYAKACRVCSSK